MPCASMILSEYRCSEKSLITCTAMQDTILIFTHDFQHSYPVSLLHHRVAQTQVQVAATFLLPL